MTRLFYIFVFVCLFSNQGLCSEDLRSPPPTKRTLGPTPYNDRNSCKNTAERAKTQRDEDAEDSEKQDKLFDQKHLILEHELILNNLKTKYESMIESLREANNKGTYITDQNKRNTMEMEKKCFGFGSMTLFNRETGYTVGETIVLDNPFLSSKYNVEIKTQEKPIKILGNLLALTGHRGEKNPHPMGHHHSERAFGSHLTKIIKTTIPSHLSKHSDKEKLVLGIYFYNRYSSCCTCHNYLSGKFTQDLTETAGVPVFFAHKGHNHHSDKKDKTPTICEIYPSKGSKPITDELIKFR